MKEKRKRVLGDEGNDKYTFEFRKGQIGEGTRHINIYRCTK